MNVAEIIAQAHEVGVRVYPQDGQVQVSIQWPMHQIPPIVRGILAEIKQKKQEITEYFALQGSQPDMRLFISALHGRGMWPVLEQGTVRLYTEPGTLGNQQLQELIKGTRVNFDTVAAYLSMHPMPPPAPGWVALTLARPDCYNAGHCRWIKYDCSLFPVMYGDEWLCRRRV